MEIHPAAHVAAKLFPRWNASELRFKRSGILSYRRCERHTSRNLTFDNDTGYNDYFDGFTCGTTISFDVSLYGPGAKFS